ncbi:putative lipid II flippase FtsW [Conexibacter sp. SYSU D00693]|uniref:putative lipid II flippase FtsW n=1 Tax=Conexibacter sp. SYSU D00693 TaxID=2812560 RepID=UPI00196B3479|nr:putative lipid II flippase FtsW [Conexibacter sp. SYSU D00693]
MGFRRRPAAEQTVEERILLTAILCLLAAGAVMVFSASSARSVLSEQGDGTHYLVQYVLRGTIGLAAMYVVARLDLRLLPKLTGMFLALAFTLLVLVKVPGIGVEINGARRWMGPGPLQFQPSELMKLALVLYCAKLLAERPRRARTPRELVPLAVVAGMAMVLIASQPDLGTALVIAFTTMALLVAAGVPLRILGMASGAGAFAVLLYALSAPYRRDRLMTFLDPWAHAADEGFQSVQGQIALGSGGFFGRGLGESQAKNLFLPEAHTDFILAIVGEEVGVVGVLALLFLYGLLAYAGLRVAKAARGTYAKLVAAGLTSLVLCQATLNVFTVLGLAPLTGVPLPFISYGSTNLIVLLASMGVLLNIARGGHAHLKVVPQGSRRSDRDADDRDRSRRDRGARRAGPRGGRRAAG